MYLLKVHVKAINSYEWVSLYKETEKSINCTVYTRYQQYNDDCYQQR